MTDNRPIGVFDSGVGGLTVLRKLVGLMPSERYVYIGDTARVPYGGKSVETIRLFARQLTEFLLVHDVKMIIAACNTVSALALDVVRSAADIPVLGTIEPAVRAAARHSTNKKVGIIGTNATINSNAYQSLLQECDPDIAVQACPCPLFVPLAEEGWFVHPATRMIAEEYLAPMRAGGADTVILGCTHYPMLSDVISVSLPKTSLINSGEETALEARSILLEKNQNAPLSHLPPNIHCYVTDKPSSFSIIAERFLGFPILNIQTISLDYLYGQR